MSVRWRLFPESLPPPPFAYDVASVFESVAGSIGTPANQLKSNAVLASVRPGLEARGFQVEKGGRGGNIQVPVLFGENGSPAKTFAVDAWHVDLGIVIEVEAGIAIDARKLYQDLFEAAAMPDARFACIAVMNEYRPPRKNNASLRDYDRASRILETLFASAKFSLSLDAIMLLGY